MSRDKLILIAITLLLSLSQPAFSVGIHDINKPLATTADSADMTTQTTTPRIDCTHLVVNDTQINSAAVLTAATYDPSTCVGIGGNTATFVGMLTSGAQHVGAACPADHPYMQATSEQWTLGGGNGWSASGLTCCTAPPNKVSAISGWENSVSGGCS